MRNGFKIKDRNVMITKEAFMVLIYGNKKVNKREDACMRGQSLVISGVNKVKKQK